MLAFDDAALARLERAARQVSWRKRGAWLRELADRVDPPRKMAAPSVSPAAARQAKARARRKNHQHVYRLELSDKAVEGFILRSILGGQLTESQALDHRCIERAIAAFVEEEGFRHA